MGFKIKNKGVNGEVQILRHEDQTLIGKFGTIKRVSMSSGKAYVKLKDEEREVEVAMKDLMVNG